MYMAAIISTTRHDLQRDGLLWHVTLAHKQQTTFCGPCCTHVSLSAVCWDTQREFGIHHYSIMCS